MNGIDAVSLRLTKTHGPRMDLRTGDPVPACRMPAFPDSRLGAGGLPRTERACAEVLSLPLYRELAPEDLAPVAGVLLDL